MAFKMKATELPVSSKGLNSRLGPILEFMKSQKAGVWCEVAEYPKLTSAYGTAAQWNKRLGKEFEFAARSVAVNGKKVGRVYCRKK